MAFFFGSCDLFQYILSRKCQEVFGVKLVQSTVETDITSGCG